MGFSLTKMLGRYLRKYWVKSTGPFLVFLYSKKVTS